MLPLGPPIEGAGLNITVLSYLDRIDFGLVACPDLIDDVWAIAEGLREALEELEEAADRLEASDDEAEGVAIVDDIEIDVIEVDQVEVIEIELD